MIGKSFLMGLVLSSAAFVSAAESIKFPAPDLKRNASLMEAFSKRASATAFNTGDLQTKDLGDLLWAANGINRSESKKRTAPSAVNAQDIDVYVVMKSGAYLYDAGSHSLTLVSAKDLRAMVASPQAPMAEAPVLLLLVSETARFKHGDKESHARLGAFDAGIVSQNISLFCAGAGLLTRARASMDAEGLKKELKLTPTQIPMLNHPVSYSK